MNVPRGTITTSLVNNQLADFRTFAHWHIESGDVDPAYPVLRWLLSDLCHSEEEEVAFILLYVAYYSLPSAVAVWLDGWREGDMLTDAQLHYGTGTERRAHRSPAQFVKHMAALRDISRRFGSLLEFIEPAPHHSARTQWTIVQRRLDMIHGNGRWAGYKTGEILNTVLGWNCPPPDAGHAHSSGPRHGLADIYPETAEMTGNDPATIAALDGLTDGLVATLRLPVAQVETVLCDWHTVLQGGYYIGHDWDMMLDQLHKVYRSDVSSLLFQARSAACEERWLGEMNDWNGVRKPLKRLYVDTGVLEWWL